MLRLYDPKKEIVFAIRRAGQVSYHRVAAGANQTQPPDTAAAEPPFGLM
jgi:hypothetical protein